MDARLLAWARRVKPGARLPRLWLFTDARRLPDPLPAIATLPRGAAGVVLRPEGFAPGYAAAVAALCRERRLVLSVAGDARLGHRLHAGLHLRGGRRPVPDAAHLTGSAHDARELLRCRYARTALVFLSPVFATSSHPGALALGVLRWAALARRYPGRVAALGGIDGDTVRRLPRSCVAVGAIGALRRH